MGIGVQNVGQKYINIGYLKPVCFFETQKSQKTHTKNSELLDILFTLD